MSCSRPVAPDSSEVVRFTAFIHALLRLKLWFVRHWGRENPQETFSSILRTRVNIAGQIGLASLPEETRFTDPGWLALETQLEERLSDDAFEEEGFSLLAPFIAPGLEERLLHKRNFSAFQAGSLSYAPTAGKPGRVTLHFANALVPRSCFEREGYMLRCFQEFLEKAEAEGARELECATWLNNVPKWLHFFPPEYRFSLSEDNRNVNRYQSYWGQFETAAGDFHEPNGDWLRRTGSMRYYKREGSCGLEALRRHLASLI